VSACETTDKSFKKDMHESTQHCVAAFYSAVCQIEHNTTYF